MVRFDEIAALIKMRITDMVPVFYHKDVEVAKKVLKVRYEGDVRASEFTNRGDFVQRVFAGIVKFAACECPEMTTGVGSIVDPATATLYIQSGADFVVGPLFDPETAKIRNYRLTAYTPGCGSVSEVGFAQEAGCDLYKIFPGDVHGPNFIKDLIAPILWSKLMVTGGMEPTRESLTSWFKAGAFYAGMGSKLFLEDKVTAGDWGYVTEKYIEALAYIAEAGRWVKFSGVPFTTDYTDSRRFLIVLIHKINH